VNRVEERSSGRGAVELLMMMGTEQSGGPFNCQFWCDEVLCCGFSGLW
jgi:hypothetical protein